MKKQSQSDLQTALRAKLRKFRGDMTQEAAAVALFMSRRGYIALEVGERPIRGAMRAFLELDNSKKS